MKKNTWLQDSKYSKKFKLYNNYIIQADINTLVCNNTSAIQLLALMFEIQTVGLHIKNK